MRREYVDGGEVENAPVDLGFHPVKRVRHPPAAGNDDDAVSKELV